MSASDYRKNDLDLLRNVSDFLAFEETEIDDTENTTSHHDNLAQIHHEWELASLLWETIQDELMSFLTPEASESETYRFVHNQTRLENLYREEILAEIEKNRRSDDWGLEEIQLSDTGSPERNPERRQRSLYYPSIRELRGLPPDKKRRRKERDHFLGRENPRRPSLN